MGILKGVWVSESLLFPWTSVWQVRGKVRGRDFRRDFGGEVPPIFTTSPQEELEINSEIPPQLPHANNSHFPTKIPSPSKSLHP